MPIPRRVRTTAHARPGTGRHEPRLYDGLFFPVSLADSKSETPTLRVELRVHKAGR